MKLIPILLACLLNLTLFAQKKSIDKTKNTDSTTQSKTNVTATPPVAENHGNKETTITDATVIDPLEAIEKRLKSIEEKPSDKFHIWDIAICLAVFLAGISFAYIKLNGRLSRHRRDIDGLSTNPEIGDKIANSGVSLTSDEKQKIYNLERTVSEMKEQFSKLEQATFSKKSKETFTHKPDDIANVVSLYEAPSEFYMGVPLENSFLINSKSDKYIEGKTMYKFKIGRVKSEAEFEFISDSETIKFIQNNSLEVVRPACIFENNPSMHTCKVTTTEKGKARFQDDKWSIIDKAKIKFM